MCANYKIPVLLIEFVENKAFTLEVCELILNHSSTSNGCIQAHSATNFKSHNKQNEALTEPDNDLLQSKLVLLTLSFPKLRVIWSSSPLQSGEIFRDLKANEAEPNVEEAKRKGGAGLEHLGSIDSWNQDGQDCLRSLPGVSSTWNLNHLMGKIRSLEEIVSVPESQLKSILGNENGHKLSQFVSKNLTS